MKSLKRFAAVVATVALTVGMCANCFAAETWGHYFGMNEEDRTTWYEGAEGKVTSQTSDSWTAELKTIGWGGCWGAQVFQNSTSGNGKVDIKKGQEYSIKCTLKSSNCDKWVYIKVAKGDGKDNLAFAKWVFIKKGSSVKVDEKFTAKANASSIYFGFGGDYGDRQNSDKDAELRYSYLPGGLTAMTTKHKDGGGDPTVATKVSCSGFYLGSTSTSSSEGTTSSSNTTNTTSGTTSTTGTTSTVSTGDFQPIACAAAAVIAAAAIVVFAKKRKAE